jgi:site-specific DNA recombinase
LLEAAVWEDVRSLLSDPRRIEEEYHRRLEGERAADRSLGRRALSVQVSRVKTGLNRLIDAYGEGLLEHAEFEPRVKQLKARLAKLTEEASSAAAAEEQEQQLRLAMGQFREFAAQVQDRLDQADWGTRRDILRALVKRVEVGPEEVRIVYRIGEARSTDVARSDNSRHCSKLQRA